MGNNINQNRIVFKPELEVITQFWINMEIKLNKIGVTSRGGVDPERREMEMTPQHKKYELVDVVKKDRMCWNQKKQIVVNQFKTREIGVFNGMLMAFDVNNWF